MRLLIRNLVLCSLSVFFLVSSPAHSAVAEHLSAVALLPFSEDQAGSYGYLGEGLRQMMAARLSESGTVTVSSPSMTPEQLKQTRDRLGAGAFRDVVRSLQADWVIAGALVAKESGLRLELMLYPGDQGGNPLSLNADAAQADDVIATVTGLSEMVVTRIAGGDEAVSPKIAQDSAQATPHGTGQGVEAFETPHPERAFKKGLFSGSAVFKDQDERFQSRGVRRSAPLPLEVETMALGDLDGDGNNDLVVASRSELRIFHFIDDRFQQVAAYDFPPTIKVHMLNIAVLDGLQKPLLFVSGNKGRDADSAIFSWDGSAKLQPLMEHIAWFIRPISWPGKGVFLLGQQVAPADSVNYLDNRIFRLALNQTAGTVTEEKTVLLPADANLFDFAVADFDGDGGNEIAMIDRKQRLLLYDDALSLVWVGSANYGGSLRYFGPPPVGQDKDTISGNTDQEELRVLDYIPGRMDVQDITGDGRPELIVVSNEVDDVSRFLPNLRAFDGGSVACLGWRGNGLGELWRTGHITGYVADYGFERETGAGADDTGRLSRLYVAQLPEQGLWRRFLPGGDDTVVLAYEMRVAD